LALQEGCAARGQAAFFLGLRQVWSIPQKIGEIGADFTGQTRFFCRPTNSANTLTEGNPDTMLKDSLDSSSRHNDQPIKVIQRSQSLRLCHLHCVCFDFRPVLFCTLCAVIVSSFTICTENGFLLY